MANVNKVILIGNVTRDPEVKFTSKGSAVTDIGLAINRNYTLDNGEKREETTYVDVELWGRLAEIAGEYACLNASKMKLKKLRTVTSAVCLLKTSTILKLKILSRRTLWKRKRELLQAI